MKSTTTRRLSVGTAFAATGILATSLAVAAWTSAGSGSGQAVATTSSDSVIASSDAGAELYPGADFTMEVSIDNPNDYPVIVTSISGGTSDPVNGCAEGSVTSDGESATIGVAQKGGGTIIAPNGSAVYTLDTHMIDDPSDACKSQTFTLPLTADLESAAS